MRHHAPRPLSAILTLLMAASCHLALNLDNYSKVEGTGGNGSGAGGQGGAGGTGCTNCGSDDACGTYSCNGGTCDAEYAAVDTLCATGACDGAGMCVPLPDGASCGGDDALCDSGFCVDGLCCAEACDGECEACNGAIPGTCEPVAAGDDPAMECVPGGGSILGGGVCDGARQCAGGGAVWARTYSDSGDQRVRAVRYDSAGNLMVLGTFNGTVDFGGGDVTADGSDYDIFVVKYAANGDHVWETILSTPTNNIAYVGAMDFDASNNIVIAGHFVGQVNVNGTNYPTGGSDGTDVFVVKVDAATGSPATPIILGGSGDQYILDIHVDSTSGAVTLLGPFNNGDWVLDASTILTNIGDFDIALISLDANLTPTAARRFGDGGIQLAHGLAVDEAGNVIIVGYFDGTISLTAPATSITATGGGIDAFIIKQSADGTTTSFAKNYGTSATDVARSVKLDSNGDIWLFGRSHTSVDLGGGMLDYAGSADTWVLKLNPAGEHLFSKSFGGPEDDLAQALAIDASDNLVLTFFSTGGFDLGGGILPPAGSVDAIIAKFAFANNNLVHLWSATYGDGQAQTFQDVTTNANGDIATGGNFQGTLAFDSTVALTLSDAGGDDGFVATFAP